MEKVHERNINDSYKSLSGQHASKTKRKRKFPIKDRKKTKKKKKKFSVKDQKKTKEKKKIPDQDWKKMKELYRRVFRSNKYPK